MFPNPPFQKGKKKKVFSISERTFNIKHFTHVCISDMFKRFHPPSHFNSTSEIYNELWQNRNEMNNMLYKAPLNRRCYCTTTFFLPKYNLLSQLYLHSLRLFHFYPFDLGFWHPSNDGCHNFQFTSLPRCDSPRALQVRKKKFSRMKMTVHDGPKRNLA